MKINLENSFLNHSITRWLLYLIGWAVLGWACWQLFLLSNPHDNMPAFARRAIYHIAFSLYLFGFFIPVIFGLAHRFAFDQKNWFWRILLHMIGALLFAFLHSWLLDFFLERRPGPRGPFFVPPVGAPRGPFRGQEVGFAAQTFFVVLRNLNITLGGYWLVLGFANGLKYYRKYKERALHATRLEAQLASAQLQALKDQLHPHFLFNTLHTLSSLIYEDVRAADKMIRQLSELLRLALDNSGKQVVTLREEIEFLNLYLEIMKTRFQDRLEAEIDAPQDVLELKAPNLILQPLVENAIKHGFEKDGGKGKVKISARKLGGNILEILITDSGPGLQMPESEAIGKGLGLKNTVARLKQMYGENYLFKLENQTPDGLQVKLQIPYATINENLH